jgi:hypothetical protein
MIKHIKYVINQKFDYVDDISLRDLLIESEWLLEKYDLSLPSAKYLGRLHTGVSQEKRKEASPIL